LVRSVGQELIDSLISLSFACEDATCVGHCCNIRDCMTLLMPLRVQIWTELVHNWVYGYFT